MRTNPEIRKKVEAIYAAYGLSLTDAIHVFLQQSLNESGLPFLLSPENCLFENKSPRLMAEIQKGWDSASDGWVSEEDAYRILGIGK